MNHPIASHSRNTAGTRMHWRGIRALLAIATLCILSNLSTAQKILDECDDLRQELKEKAQAERKPNPESVHFGGDCYNCYPFLDGPGELDGHTADAIDKMSCDEIFALAQKVSGSADRDAEEEPADLDLEQARQAIKRWITAPSEKEGPWTVADDQDAIDRLAEELGMEPPNSTYPKAPGDTAWEKTKKIGEVWWQILKGEAAGQAGEHILERILPQLLKRVVGVVGWATTATDVFEGIGKTVRIAKQDGPTAEQQAASNRKVHQERIDAIRDRLNDLSRRTGRNDPVFEGAIEEFRKFRRNYGLH